MNEDRIRDRLVERGKALFSAPRELVEFTNHDGADHLLNDLTHHPHAFVLGSVMDRQMKAERAWIIPFRFMEKLGSFSMETLLKQIEFSDYFSIDIFADVHVRRAFGRLGLTPADATIEQLVFRARGLHPEFPGLMDSPAWEIGRNWCRPTQRQCGDGYMNDLCPSAQGQSSDRRPGPGSGPHA